MPSALEVGDDKIFALPEYHGLDLFEMEPLPVERPAFDLETHVIALVTPGQGHGARHPGVGRHIKDKRLDGFVGLRTDTFGDSARIHLPDGVRQEQPLTDEVEAEAGGQTLLAIAQDDWFQDGKELVRVNEPRQARLYGLVAEHRIGERNTPSRA